MKISFANELNEFYLGTKLPRQEVDKPMAQTQASTVRMNEVVWYVV